MGGDAGEFRYGGLVGGVGGAEDGSGVGHVLIIADGVMECGREREVCDGWKSQEIYC